MIFKDKYLFQQKFIFLFLITTVSVFPFIYLSRYNLLLSDEFIAMHYREKMNLIQYIYFGFNTWTGRYTSNFLEVIYPLKINYLFYQLIPLFTGFLFFTLLYCIIKNLSDKLLLFKTILIFIFILNYLPSIADFYYYIPAVIIYTISILIILSCIFIWTTSIQAKYKFLYFIFTNILILGTTELYIPLVLFLSFVFLINAIKKNEHIILNSINFGIVLTIIILLLSMKGNMQRYGSQKIELSIFNCISNYYFAIKLWTTRFLIVIPFIILFISYIKSNSNKNPNYCNSIQNSHIIIFAAGYLLIFTPLLFINILDYKRIGNLFFLYFLFLNFLIAFKYVPKLSFWQKNIRIIVILATLVFFISGNIKRSYVDIKNSYTKNYSIELKKRYVFLEQNKNSSTLEIKKIPVNDYILSVQDVNVSEDNDLAKLIYQRYYHIDSIIFKIDYE